MFYGDRLSQQQSVPYFLAGFRVSQVPKTAGRSAKGGGKFLRVESHFSAAFSSGDSGDFENLVLRGVSIRFRESENVAEKTFRRMGRRCSYEEHVASSRRLSSSQDDGRFWRHAYFAAAGRRVLFLPGAEHRRLTD